MQRHRRRRRPVPKATQLVRYVSREIRRLRIERGLTQTELGGEYLTRAGISALERAVTAPSLHVIGYLARRLRVRPGDLLPPH